MTHYFSYSEQAGHYFARPHQAPAQKPLESPAAWRGPETDVAEWRIELAPAQVEELDRALAQAKASGNAADGLAGVLYGEDHSLAGSLTSQLGDAHGLDRYVLSLSQGWSKELGSTTRR